MGFSDELVWVYLVIGLCEVGWFEVYYEEVDMMMGWYFIVEVVCWVLCGEIVNFIVIVGVLVVYVVMIGFV